MALKTSDSRLVIASIFRVPPVSQKRKLLCYLLLAGLALEAGCGETGQFSADAKTVSMGLFEVVDCKSAKQPITLKASDKKYCLADKPIVDETDVRAAHASRDQSGKPILVMFFTIKTGQRINDYTQRVYTEHLKRKEQAQLGFVIDGKLVTVAALSGAISDTIEISGAFSWEEALQLAQSLNASRPLPSSSN